MAYSYDEIQGTAKPAHMGSQSLDPIGSLGITPMTAKDRIEMRRDFNDLNPPVRAPAYPPGYREMDPQGMGRDVRID